MKPQIKEKLGKLKSSSINVQLTSGRLKVVPNELKQCVYIKNLDLFGNSIQVIPDWFFQFKCLENLSLKNNNIKDFPTIVFTLEKLTSLNLSENQIVEVTEQQFLNLMNFEKVDISYNSIKEINFKKSEVYKCTHLNIKGNKLGVFPKAISQITTLEKLNLSENNITSFPDDAFNELEDLIELDLSYNQLTYLPSSIGRLRKLKKLNLSGNKLSTLPIEFENLVNLESLELDGNPIGNVPIEVSNQGVSGIINYYLSLGDNVQLFEAKLLIVGQGNVGKTYLMNRLMHDSVPETKTTEGIDIKTWTIKTKSSVDFRVNIWDFGGQEIYHSTHQFF